MALEKPSQSVLALEKALRSVLGKASRSVLAMGKALESVLALGKASRSEGGSVRVPRRSELLRRDRIAVLHCRPRRRRRC